MEFVSALMSRPFYMLNYQFVSWNQAGPSNLSFGMRQILQVHQVASSRHNEVDDRLVMPSANGCEIASLLINVRLPLLNWGVHFRWCLDIKVRAMVT